MNAIAKIHGGLPAETDVIRVLQNSLYPGARAESVALVLAWCRATGRDPMKKPIHIVPMWVKDAATGKGEMRDVLMPGIGTYRTDAANSGQYAGKSDPEFGPDVTRQIDHMEVTFPQWCRVTVTRLVNGKECSFTAKEYWMENYASGKEKKGVNDMWKKRPYGQLAKCAESQALRMAFPDETGNSNTAEEMEGKTFEGMTIDAAAEPLRRQPDAVDADVIPALARDEREGWAEQKVAAIATATLDELHAFASNAKISAARARLADAKPELDLRIADALAARFEALRPSVDEVASDEWSLDATEPVPA